MSWWILAGVGIYLVVSVLLGILVGRLLEGKGL